MTKICKCSQTQIKFHEDETGYKWYSTSLINGNTGQYALESVSGYIMLGDDQPKYFTCQNPSCENNEDAMIFTDHIN